MMRLRKVSLSLWMTSLLAASILSALPNPTQGLTVHPAVFKNFVGPYRVRQREPILRSTIPFGTLPVQVGNLVSADTLSPEDPISFEQGLAQISERKSNLREEGKDPRTACQGNENCRRNLDSTLSLLMKMMETGR